MVATLRARGGLHTEADFAAGRTAAEFVEPIRIGWHGYEVWQCPPNGSGLLVLMMLGILGRLRTRRRTGRWASTRCTATSRRRGWPTATATPSSPTRRRWTCRWRA